MAFLLLSFLTSLAMSPLVQRSADQLRPFHPHTRRRQHRADANTVDSDAAVLPLPKNVRLISARGFQPPYNAAVLGESPPGVHLCSLEGQETDDSHYIHSR
jgi:hypothetical protein